MSKKITYNDALAEIEGIIYQIENEDLDVDDLTEKVKRMTFLLTLCKDKLHTAEKEVQKVLKSIDAEAEN